MLTRLYIDNYRTFEGFTWRPGRVALLIGRNGSGKSSLFDLFYALRNFLNDDGSVGCFPPSTCARWSPRRVNQVFELEVELDGVTFIYRLELLHDPSREESRVTEEHLHTATGKTLFHFLAGVVQLHDEAGTKIAEFKASPKHSNLAAVVPDASNHGLTAFRSWITDALVVRPIPAKMSSRAPIESPRLTKDLDNFADWYRYNQLNRPDAIAAANAAFAEIVPGFRNMVMRVDEQRVGWLRANFGDAAPYSLSFSELSEGQRVLFAFYVLLHTNGRLGGLLALDEPDNFVALEEIQPLLFQLLDHALVDGGPQLFIASHHPEYLDQLAPTHGWVLDRPTGHATTIGRFTADVALSASSLVARGELPTTANET